MSNNTRRLPAKNKLLPVADPDVLKQGGKSGDGSFLLKKGSGELRERMYGYLTRIHSKNLICLLAIDSISNY